jgi:hypothetical protein
VVLGLTRGFAGVFEGVLVKKSEDCGRNVRLAALGGWVSSKSEIGELVASLSVESTDDSDDRFN